MGEGMRSGNLAAKLVGVGTIGTSSIIVPVSRASIPQECGRPDGRYRSNSPAPSQRRLSRQESLGPEDTVLADSSIDYASRLCSSTLPTNSAAAAHVASTPRPAHGPMGSSCRWTVAWIASPAVMGEIC